ncbi:hypothetical protein ST37_06805 [Vibrio sp. qd031]|uniref:hypothetical protein n=1 Tax=Vibrio sp. qd031 TaxID=1603038 RepID=UPI000A0FB88A|nr:hypothetical protein [Vibrio sp. qd031]ORT51075.1 hypothetical protein ST37_06805 [Vibrio sp. qd031]
MDNTITIDVEQLKSVTSASAILEYLFLHAINDMQGDTLVSSVDLLKMRVQDSAGVFFLRSALVSALHEVEKIGVGRFGKPLYGRETKFYWNTIGLQSIARLALGTEGIDDDMPKFEEEISTHFHRFNLRDHYEFVIELPEDLTHEEANRIGQLCIGLATPHYHHGSKPAIYVFALRNGLDFELVLPRDLTQSEAFRLSTFIEILPTNDDEFESNDDFDFEGF